MLDFYDFSREDMSDLLERILHILLMKLQIFDSRIWLRILWKERDLALAFDRCHAVPQATGSNKWDQSHGRESNLP